MFLVGIVRDDNHEKVFEDNNVLLESVILMKIYTLGATMFDDNDTENEDLCVDENEYLS